MSWLVGPYLLAAALLVVAGGPKVRRPEPVARALASLGWPARRTPVRLLGLVEVSVGAAALLIGGRLPAALVAASYAGFAAFLAVARHRGGVLSSCGCFGTADTPVTGTHLPLVLGFALVAGAVAARPVGPVPELLRQSPAAALAVLGLAALGTWFSYLALAVAPRTSGPAVARSYRMRNA